MDKAYNFRPTPDFTSMCDWGYLDEHRNVVRFESLQAFMDKMKEPGYAEKYWSHEQRCVKQEQVADEWVSTVFLGLEHGMGFCGGKEYWFETMVFIRPGGVFPRKEILGQERDVLEETYCERYTTYQEALIGHTLVVNRLKEGKSLSEPVEELCQDEGCPHAGRDHVCINSQSQSG